MAEPLPVTHVGIIGSSRPVLTVAAPTMWNALVEHAVKEVSSIPGNVAIHTGGAAWGDQLNVAVAQRLPGKVTAVYLELPCPLLATGYYDNGGSSWITNPGRLSNIHHHNFSLAVHQDRSKSLKDLYDLKAVVRVHDGFHARNTLIAKESSIILAYHDSSDRPTTGGTADTLKKTKGQIRCFSYATVLAPKIVVPSRIDPAVLARLGSG